ncbi:MAG: Cof-type HAD-IIB family hydrolase [Treponema sp.]|nr:Cof-type HAD-IIB family hydrolase [Treponema sp.]
MLVTVKPINKSSMEIKALAFDLDGTLLGPSVVLTEKSPLGSGAVLTDRTLRAVKACAEKGLELIIATGRAVEASEKFRIPMEAHGPMVYFNGAIIADMPSGKILHTTLVSKEIAKFCLELSRKKGVYFQLYKPGTAQMPGQPLLTAEDHLQRELYHKHTGILAGICDLDKLLEDPHLQGCIKCMFLADPGVLDGLRPFIEERFGKDVYVVRSTSTFLEILNPGVSKGVGLELALKHRGIKPAETIAFGDEENDLPMFKNAGISVAPANAREKVKAAADWVTASNAEDGVAVFLENYIL